jgi:hypothetical protein
MSEFAPPVTTRNGTDIAYKFNIVKTNTVISDWFNNIDELKAIEELKKVIILRQNKEDFNFYNEFLNFSNSYFSKKYTFDSFKKYLDHQISFLKNTKPLRIYPNSFIFTTKGIFLNWHCEDDSLLPELIEPTDAHHVASQSTAQTHVRTQAADIPIQLEQSVAVPEEVNLDGAPILDLDEISNSDTLVAGMSRAFARSKVREARLKARIARLKAERTTEKYLSKYGATYSDLEDSETETETENDDETSGDEQ